MVSKSVKINYGIKSIIWGLLFFINISSQYTYGVVIEPESVLHQVLEKSSNVYQFYAETKVSVYDPEAFAALSDETDTRLKPYELNDKSFFQNIVFVRDEFVSIETLDDAGNVLHVYVQEIGGRKFFENLSTERFFNEQDIRYPSLTFFTKFIELFEKNLASYSISPNDLKYINQEYKLLYQLGTEQNNIKIDPNSYNVLEFQNQIQIQGRYYPIQIEFSDWNRQRESIPEVIRYYVNSRLFKESRIINIQFSRIYPHRNKVLRKYQDLFPTSSPFSIANFNGQ